MRQFVEFEGKLRRYLQEIAKFPMLQPDEEARLAHRWRADADMGSAHKLVTSHLLLVVKIAMGYRGYGLPLNELISEGNVGLIQAVERFDPGRGLRLSTYAKWWIRAGIQEYVLRSWSLVKIGTTAAQKRLFFKLRSVKRQLRAIDDGDLSPEIVAKITVELAVPEVDVVSMNRRLAGRDHSLNAPLREAGNGEWQDWLVDNADDQEMCLGAREERDERRKLLEEALRGLRERDRHILVARRLRDVPASLAELSERYNISRERVRQIELVAFRLLRKRMTTVAIEQHARADDPPASQTRRVPDRERRLSYQRISSQAVAA